MSIRQLPIFPTACARLRSSDLKSFIRHRYPLRNPEDTVVLIRPGQFITLNVYPPASDISNCLCAAEVLRSEKFHTSSLSPSESRRYGGSHPTRSIYYVECLSASFRYFQLPVRG